MGALSTGKKPKTWKKTLKVNSQDITFKLDTGAVIPGTAYSRERHGPLTKAAMLLCGPSNEPLKVRGPFSGVMEYKDRATTQTVYVVQKLATPLLGLPAISDLKLLHIVDRVRVLESHMKKQYPKVFTGLGCLKEEYRIKLKEDAKPYALSLPWHLPRIEKMGVIKPIEKATDWCAGMVVAPNPIGKIRICSDMTHLNEYICQERHILQAVNETLAKLPVFPLWAAYFKWECLGQISDNIKFATFKSLRGLTQHETMLKKFLLIALCQESPQMLCAKFHGNQWNRLGGVWKSRFVTFCKFAKNNGGGHGCATKYMWVMSQNFPCWGRQYIIHFFSRFDVYSKFGQFWGMFSQWKMQSFGTKKCSFKKQ